MIWVLAALLPVILIAVIWYAWLAFPVISGYGAKNLCSAVYLQRRKAADVIREDLGKFPLSLGSFKLDEQDSSVTATVGGFAKRKAIYRQGLGCTLINDFTEAEVRAQRFNLPPQFAADQANIPWPAGDKTASVNFSEIDTAVLATAITNVMHSSFDGQPSFTRAVIVVYDGHIVAEQYAPGFDQRTLQLGWSLSKSLTAALIGVLVKEEKLNIDDPAPVREWKNTAKEKITTRHLLQQTSGLDFKEDYVKPSEVTNMLFKRGDMAGFTAALPLKYGPGTVFNYSSGNANVLSRIIRDTTGEKNYPSFLYDALFHKINMYSLLMEPDASGTFIGSSYSYATARDFARFGLLYYSSGVWNGEQVLPRNWVKSTTTPFAADKQQHYGYQFWLNGFDEKEDGRRWYTDVPADLFFAHGYGGQGIYIIPSKKLVVVRLGLQEIDTNKFLKEICNAIRS